MIAGFITVVACVSVLVTSITVEVGSAFAGLYEPDKLVRAASTAFPFIRSLVLFDIVAELVCIFQSDIQFTWYREVSVDATALTRVFFYPAPCRSHSIPT